MDHRADQRKGHIDIEPEALAFGAFKAIDAGQGPARQRNTEQPYCRAVIGPKVAKLRAHFAERLRAEPAGR